MRALTVAIATAALFPAAGIIMFTLGTAWERRLIVAGGCVLMWIGLATAINLCAYIEENNLGPESVLSTWTFRAYEILRDQIGRLK